MPHWRQARALTSAQFFDPPSAKDEAKQSSMYLFTGSYLNKGVQASFEMVNIPRRFKLFNSILKTIMALVSLNVNTTVFSHSSLAVLYQNKAKTATPRK